MNCVGIDIHKKYSVLCAQDERGTKLREARIEGNSKQAYAHFFRELEGPSQAVLEACWNWGLTHDLLEEIDEVEEVVLTHPYKTRLIADAQIKTDRLDAFALGTLLRGNLVARAYIPPGPTRARRNLLRQRLYWARLRTMLGNRIHALIDRQHNLELPQCSAIFGARSLSFLRSLELAEPDQTLLKEALALHDLIGQQMKAQEKRIAAQFKAQASYACLQSVPGIGLTLGAVIACEIDQIERFSSAEKLCAYAGVVPSTYSSGGKGRQGRLLTQCNKWLRWALVEASWVAISCSPYFGAIYRQQRARGKKANTPIIIVARRMCRILYQLLKEKRSFLLTATGMYGPGRAQAIDAAFTGLASLLSLVSTNAPQVTNVTDTDLAAIGIPLVKKPTRTTQPPDQVQNVLLDNGANPGEVEGTCDPAGYNTRVYEGQWTLDPNGEHWSETSIFPNSRSIIFNGLTRGKDVWVRVRARNVKGAGAWSNPAVIMVA